MAFPRRSSLAAFAGLLAAIVCVYLVLDADWRDEVDFSRVPGVVVGRLPVPSTSDRLFRRAVYTASPSIAVLAPEDYVITDNLFGPGSGADRSGTTRVFRSRDGGLSWRELAPLRDMKRGSLFVNGGALYLFGYRAAPGDLLIRRSRDGGETWSEPRDETDGVLRRGEFGGTPNRPVIHEGRIWIAVSGRRVMSAPVDSDLLRADSWTLSDRADTSRGPFGKKAVITEGQVVASPETGVVVMPKIQGEPSSVLLRVGKHAGRLRDPDPGDWVAFPGGEKKFAVGFDPVTGSFFALSNPVLPAYEDSGWPPEMIRNAAALLISRDLREWRVATVFLESPNVDHEAFQYLAYDIDGADLVIAARTAFEIGDGKPPRGHDSNLTTFHRIEDFRRFLASDGDGEK
jgi:hypothetical protein